MFRIPRRSMLLGTAGLAFSTAKAAASSGVVAAVARDASAPAAGSGGASNCAAPAGTEIEVGQTITACRGEAIDLLLVDGTSITLEPESSIVIDHHIVDPTNGKIFLVVTILHGVIHLISNIHGLIEKLEKLERIIERRVENRIENRIDERIKARIEERIKERVIEERIKERVEARIENKIEERVEARIRERVQARVEDKIEEIEKIRHLRHIHSIVVRTPAGPVGVHDDAIVRFAVTQNETLTLVERGEVREIPLGRGPSTADPRRTIVIRQMTLADRDSTFGPAFSYEKIEIKDFKVKAENEPPGASPVLAGALAAARRRLEQRLENSDTRQRLSSVQKIVGVLSNRPYQGNIQPRQ